MFTEKDMESKGWAEHTNYFREQGDKENPAEETEELDEGDRGNLRVFWKWSKQNVTKKRSKWSAVSAATDRLCNVRTEKGPMDSIIEKGSFGGMMGGRAEVE